jgi:hypothetical protein
MRNAEKFTLKYPTRKTSFNRKKITFNLSGITAGEILLSHVLTQVVVIILQTMECLLLSFLLFGMESNGSVFLVTLLTILEGFCGMCFGKFKQKQKI